MAFLRNQVPSFLGFKGQRGNKFDIRF
jgi:hypothetical protein